MASTTFLDDFGRTPRPLRWLGQGEIAAGRELAQALALLLAVVLVRSPGLVFGFLNIDEADFFLMARKMLSGALPYVQVVEIKPILAYLAYLPGALSGFHMWPMQLLGVAWAFATLWILKAAAEIWTGRREIGWAAAWLGLLASGVDVPAVNTELFLNLAAAGALYFFIRGEKEGRRLDWLWAGVCAGLATLFKHQAGILLVALLISQLWPRSWSADREPRNSGAGARLAKAGAITLGFAFPWAATALLYLALGHFGSFFEWNVTRNFSYVSDGSTGHQWIRLVQSVAVCVLAGTPLPWFFAIRGNAGPRQPIRFGLSLLLWLTWIPVSLGGRFYEHYFLQFAPPLALLGAGPFVEFLEGWSQLALKVRAAMLVALFLPPVGLLAVGFGFGIAHRYPEQNAKAVELAKWISAHSSPTDTLFVWGYYSPIYYLAKRDPGTRYVTMTSHIGRFDPHHLPPDFDASAHQSPIDIDRTIADLESNRPLLVVDTSPANIHDWSKAPLRKFPKLNQYIATHYTWVAAPAGAPVYRRRDSVQFSSAGEYRSPQ